MRAKQKRNVFRVVVVQGVMIAWASSKLFSSEQRAISYIKRLVTADKNLYGYEAERFFLEPWSWCCMDEAARHTWLSVHLITTVFDKTVGLWSSYGVVAYELD